MVHKKRLTSSNDDIDLEVTSIGYSVFERKVVTSSAIDIVSHQLLLPLPLPVAVLMAVVFRRDDDAGLIRRKVRDNVTPTFVIVDTQSDDADLVGVGHEAKGAARSAAAHGEDMGPVNFAPCPAVSEFPDRLLDDAEECVRITLVDTRGDCVTHSRRNNERVDKKRF